jgi:hypothetical protein
MTDDDIKERIERISGFALEDERAHIMEDELHQDVLLAISEGKCKDPARAAHLALRTKKIKFGRWYA